MSKYFCAPSTRSSSWCQMTVVVVVVVVVVVMVTVVVVVVVMVSQCHVVVSCL